MNVGELRAAMADLPDDAEVLVDGLIEKRWFDLFDAYNDTDSLYLVSTERPVFGPLSR